MDAKFTLLLVFRAVNRLTFLAVFFVSNAYGYFDSEECGKIFEKYSGSQYGSSDLERMTYLLEKSGMSLGFDPKKFEKFKVEYPALAIELARYLVEPESFVLPKEIDKLDLIFSSGLSIQDRDAAGTLIFFKFLFPGSESKVRYALGVYSNEGPILPMEEVALLLRCTGFSLYGKSEPWRNRIYKGAR